MVFRRRAAWVVVAAVLGGCSDGASAEFGPGLGDDSSGDSGSMGSRDSGQHPSDAGAGSETASSSDGGASDSATQGDTSSMPPPQSPPSTGKIDFHLLLGVAGMDTPGDSLTLDGDNYTDLMMSNFIAGVMYGHLIQTYTPGMQFDADYLYGSIFGQLLQENLATEYYMASSSLIDPSPDQAAVMGAGQGGPYQINNYADDMVYGSYTPMGYALINYVALQKNIGYPLASAATQYAQDTPAPFNDKFYGPMLTAYFHFNDYVALQEIGPIGGYTPPWEPNFDHAVTTFKSLPGNFLEVLLNVAYNQGYYGTLMTSYSALGATATASTVATVDGYASVWGVSDTYKQYPYQVRYYLDQVYDNPIPTTSPTTTTTPTNHVRFGMAALGATFATVFAKLAYVDATAGYVTIDPAKATAAFASALSEVGVASDAALDMSAAASRAQVFRVLEKSITTLESSIGASFTARSTTAL